MPVTARRPSPPAAALAAPARVLAPARATHGRDAAVVAALGVAGWGAAPLLNQPGLARPLLLVAVAAAGLLLVVGGLRRRRADLRDRLVEALAPMLGTRGPDRRSVELRRWSGRRPGSPRQVRIWYAPGAPDADPAWTTSVRETLYRRLQADFAVVRHDRSRCRLDLRRVDGPANPAPSETRVRVERTIAELIGPTAKVTEVGVDASGSPSTIEVRHEAGTKLAAGGYRARVERTLSAVLPGRWRARWDLENDSVVFEVRPTFPDSIWLPPPSIDQDRDVLATYDEVELPFGVDEDGHQQVWRPAIDPNLMVVGTPGTGKTVFEHAVLAGASAYGWPIWVVDGKAVEFLGFRSWPNVQVVATTVQEQVAVIERAWEVMEHRYQLIVTGRASETDFEPLMVFLDEFADFRSNLTDWYASIKVKGDPARPPVLAKAGSIARKGRTSRVHLLFATQRPDAEYFGGDMRDNFRARISMGRLSPQGAMMMWQDPVTGTTIPRGCRGRATTINDANRAIEIQAYRVPDPRKAERTEDRDDLERLEQLRPTSGRHERLLIVPPEDESDLDSGEPVRPTYREYAAAAWVRATDRPDLDPLQAARSASTDPRELASPLSIFGISRTDSAPTSAPTSRTAERTPGLRLVVSPTAEGDRSVQDSGSDEEPAVEDVRFEGYGAAVDVPPDRVSVGDLICVDADLDHWAVVDEEPDEDLMDPGCLALPWRDDADEQGIVSVPASDRIGVRHPLQED